MPEIHSIPGFAEPFSCFTHLFASGVFALLGAILLVRTRARRQRWAPLSVFVFSTVFLLSMSGVYHLLDHGGAGRAVLQRLDHAAIFVLIAGSFTAVHGILFQRWERWGVILLIWACAITGLTLKVVFFNDMPEWLGVSIYLAMGWLGVVTGVMVWRQYGYAFMRLILWGGLAYTVGAVLEFARFPVLIPGVVGPHELFHIAVLVGLSCHWAFIWRVARMDEAEILSTAHFRTHLAFA